MKATVLSPCLCPRGRSGHRHAFRREAVAKTHDICHLNGDMAEGVAGLIGLVALPVLHQLDGHAGKALRATSRDRPAKTGSSCARGAPARSCRVFGYRNRRRGRGRRRAAWRGPGRIRMCRSPCFRRRPFSCRKARAGPRSTFLPAYILVASMPSAAQSFLWGPLILATSRTLQSAIMR